jgi:hypothetical protein
LSFISQSIKNRFPEWSKVKRDSSSNMSILLDAVGEEIESLRESGYALKLQQKNLLSEPIFEESKMYKFDLMNDENYSFEEREKDIRSFTLMNGEENIPVITSWSEYCFGYPENFEQEKIENILFIELRNSSNNEYILNKPSQLFVILENVKGFEDSNEIDSKVTIRGLNALDIEIEEHIEFNNLKTYKTRNYFKTIKGLNRTNRFLNRPEVRGGPGIEINGLDLNSEESKVIISTHSFGVTKEQVASQVTIADSDPFLETVYTNESNLKNELFLEFMKEEGKTFIKLIHKFVRDEKKILTASSKLSKDFFEEVLFKGELMNSSGDEFETQDWAIDRKRNKLVVLDNEDNLLYYTLSKPAFERNSLITESKDIDIVIEASESHVLKEEEFILNFQLERPKGSIAEFFILKTLSSDNHRNIMFLNNEKVWGEALHSFQGKDLENKFENITPAFYVTDSLLNYEQANYYAVSCRRNIVHTNAEELINKINKLISEDTKGYYSYRSSVLAAKINPEHEIETIDLEEGDKEISIQGVSSLLYVKGAKTKSYKEIKNKAYFSAESNCIYLKERYENNLSLTLEFSDNTSFSTELIYANS